MTVPINIMAIKAILPQNPRIGSRLSCHSDLGDEVHVDVSHGRNVEAPGKVSEGLLSIRVIEDVREQLDLLA